MEDLIRIVSKVLGIDRALIDDGMSRYNTPEWDSFSHLLLISQIEKELGIKLTMSQMERIRTFRDLVEIVENGR